MPAARAMAASFAALAVAILPGALGLVPGPPRLQRQPLATAVDPIESAAEADPPPAEEMAAPAPPTTVAAVAPAPPVTTAVPPMLAPAQAAPPRSSPPAPRSAPAPAPAPPPMPMAQARSGGSGTVHALLIGIDDYPGSGYDLASAVGDADTIERAMVHFGVPAANREVLRDGQADRGQVVAAVQRLVQRAGTGSTIVLAYAGHVRKVDSDTEAIITADGGVLTDRELAGLLAPARASAMWVVMATCYGGGFTELLGPGRVLTAASDAASRAYESPHLGASYLVHHMVREGWLEGKAGPTVAEAFAYADARIQERYPSRRPVQLGRADGLRFGSRLG